MKKAIVIGISEERGLGAHLSKRLAKEGLHVFLASSTQSNLASLASTIEKEGGKATAVCTDATNEDEVKSLFNLLSMFVLNEIPNLFNSTSKFYNT